MQISIETPAGMTTAIEVERSDSANTFKAKIEVKEGLDQLEDCHNTSDCKIKEGSTVNKERCLPGRDTMQIFAKHITGKTFALTVTRSDKINDVKMQIEQMVGIPPNQQVLIFGGKTLEADHTIANYGIQNLFTLHLVLRFGGGR